MPSSPANAPSLVRKLSDSSPGLTPTERADLAPGLRGNPGENEETLASREPLLTPPSVASILTGPAWPPQPRAVASTLVSASQTPDCSQQPPCPALDADPAADAPSIGLLGARAKSCSNFSLFLFKNTDPISQLRLHHCLCPHRRSRAVGVDHTFSVVLRS
ncbi:hypothetical protein P7K49_017432 [Saguinus oedipus]|uniref:Uncharacterized protein n=1 Tax=Saguinus oedipus TaxID=9490 RepID=A0ABQ9V2X2_SAGOE|nr:hypothetical protein P7K49_017432 [Saguinus oedipus]